MYNLLVVLHVMTLCSVISYVYNCECKCAIFILQEPLLCMELGSLEGGLP